MLRTRLVWFTVGFSVTAAAIGQFTWRDLLADRYALSSHVKQELDSLEARVNKLEALPTQRSRPAPQVVEPFRHIRNGHKKWAGKRRSGRRNCPCSGRRGPIRILGWVALHL